MGITHAARRHITRRLLLLATPAALTVGTIRPAVADTTDLVIMCDPTLQRPLAGIGEAFRAKAGVRIHVFATAPGLILPQLTHDVQNDILVTQVGVLQQAERAGLLSGARSGNWSNPLVIAEMAGAAGPAAAGKFAVSELPAASGVDGAGVVAKLGLPSSEIISAIDTPGVAFLLTSGAARTGLLYLTDVRADPRLRVLRPLEDMPAAIFAAAVSKGARRPNPAGFVEFLGTVQARERLAASGLEPVA